MRTQENEEVVTPGTNVAGHVIRDIEVLRGVAILMVLVEHLPINLLWWKSWLFRFADEVWHGAMGVDLFFVISGFVIARGLLPKLMAATTSNQVTHILRHFWIRRAFRLLPAAWCWLAIPLWCSSALGASSWFGDFRHSMLMTQYAFFNIADLYVAITLDAALQQYHFYGASVGYWSLSLEEQFYLLLPMVALVFRSRLPILLACAVVYQFLVPFIPLTDFTRPGALATGVLLAIASRQPWYETLRPTALFRSRVLRAMFLLFCIAVLGWLGVQSTSWKLGLVAIVSGALVLVASFDADGIWPEQRTKRAMMWLGSRSYALYLAHMPAFLLVREVIGRYYGPAPPHQLSIEALAVTVATCLALLAAELTHRFVELPSRNYGRRLSGYAFAEPVGAAPA